MFYNECREPWGFRNGTQNVHFLAYVSEHSDKKRIAENFLKKNGSLSKFKIEIPSKKSEIVFAYVSDHSKQLFWDESFFSGHGRFPTKAMQPPPRLRSGQFDIKDAQRAENRVGRKISYQIISHLGRRPKI